MTHQPSAQTHLAQAIIYKVQCSVGPNPKSRYESRYTGENRAKAELIYQGINIGRGYRKRLVAFSPEFLVKRVLRKEVS